MKNIHFVSFTTDYDLKWSIFIFNRIKSHAASKYGLASQPRLVDIIAAVPAAYKKVSE